jgi:hypothetical protein
MHLALRVNNTKIISHYSGMTVGILSHGQKCKVTPFIQINVT